MHIDIWIYTDNGIIPIELKYKTKRCRKEIDNEIYVLKNHGAKDINCYAYLKDLERIEMIKEKTSGFVEGYTVFITNETSYTRKPVKENCVYKDFSLEEGICKSGILDWSEEAGEGTKKGCENPITIKGKYVMNWKEYSVVDDTNTGTFVYLVNKVKK